MSGEELTLESRDAHRIPATFWAAAEPRGLVQILHGMAEHHARYARLAAALNERGWSVIAHDHRGHGRAASRDRDLGHFADEDGWARVIDDLRVVREEGRRRVPDGELVVLGHSMGSFIALHEQCDDRSADKLVLSGSNLGGGALVQAGRVAAKAERLRLGKRGQSRLLSFLSFGSFNNAFKPTRTDFDWLSRDPIEVDAYVADPRCGFECTTQLWVDLLGALLDLGDLERLGRLRRDMSVYIVSGDRDPVSDGGKGVRALAERLKLVGLTDVTLRLWPEGRHEVFNETNRDEVTEELLSFLDR